MHGGRTRTRDERGAATLETVGMTIVAALIAVGVLLAALPQGTIIAETFAYHVCQVVTFGQGGCTPPSTSPEAHEPDDPCVVSQDGWEAALGGGALFFTIEGGKRVEVQRLSNGDYEVTVLDSGGAGVTAGLGGGLGLTVADHGAGVEATADASAGLVFQGGTTYTTDEDHVDDLVKALIEDQVKNSTVGHGPIRWGVDLVEDVAGVGYDLPDPSSVQIEGGITVDASAEAQGIVGSGNAGISATKVLGMTVNSDGTKTIYVSTTVSGEAGLESLGIDTSGVGYDGASLDGELQVVNELTFDSNWNMTDFSVTASSNGASHGLAAALFGGDVDTSMDNEVANTTVWSTSLPIQSDGDRAIVNNYLATVGVAGIADWSNPLHGLPQLPTSANFFDAAQDRGTTTQLEYDTDSDTWLAASGEVEVGAVLGIEGEISSDSMQVTDAKYWDGSQWVPWEGCSE